MFTHVLPSTLFSAPCLGRERPCSLGLADLLAVLICRYESLLVFVSLSLFDNGSDWLGCSVDAERGCRAPERTSAAADYSVGGVLGDYGFLHWLPTIHEDLRGGQDVSGGWYIF